MSDYEPIKLSRDEGGGFTISVNCPECGERNYPRISASWGGTEQTSFYCHGCREELLLAGVKVKNE